ncbi:MAG: hypothetical protein K2O18_19215 [Oscillospiraceae bacterium]|nr:hypothetical protein [Oscillospiraceae bacterium]
MSELYKKMYLALFYGTEDVMKYINREMVIPETYDWDHTREILLRLQAAFLAAEDLYMNATDD